MFYECPRCDYNSSRKYDMVNHLNRKNTCKFTKRDIPIIDCFFLISNKKNKDLIQCEYCSRKFDRNSNLEKHSIKCKNKLLETLKKENDNLKQENEKLKQENENLNKNFK